MIVWLLIPTVCTHMAWGGGLNGESRDETSCQRYNAAVIYETESACKENSAPRDNLTDVAGQTTHTTYECEKYEVRKS